MQKNVAFLKRKPGMTMQEFVEYYETRHAPLAEQYLQGVSVYVRRYVDVGDGPELDFDVITEVWSDNPNALARFAEPEVAALIEVDEENLFDRTKSRFVTVTERETDLFSSG